MDPSEFDASRFLKTVTEAPGVYCMYDKADEVIYVGKAKSLKKRLSSYFRKNLEHPKTRVLVAQIFNIDVTVTNSEAEALILENEYIKKYRPRYNVLLRDDKSYPYIILTRHKHPRLAFHRGPKRTKGDYFGPFPSGGAVRESLNLLQRLFSVRQCEDSFYRARSRPCLQYQIKRCTAPCVNLVSEHEYEQQVELTRLFLKGHSQSVIAKLVEQMEAAAQSLKFEEAARIRDQITSLRKVQEQHAVSGQRKATDFIAIEQAQNQTCCYQLMVREGRVTGSKSLFPKVPSGTDYNELAETLIYQLYGRTELEGGAPREIILSHLPSDVSGIEEVLSTSREQKISISSASRGEKARFLKLAVTNANMALTTRLSSQKTLLQRYLMLAEQLELDKVPKRIECFDISHTFGSQTVASCVVFDQQGARKSDYRKYNIEGITPGDDYAAMKQALQRRFRILDNPDTVPDILLIDGGKGQLTQAEEVVAECDWEKVKKKPLLVGVAKGESRKPGLETLILGDTRETFHLDGDNVALHLIQQVRDEAHRFAITGHRARRQKNASRSSLEDIPGIGAKKRQSLIKFLGGMQEVQRATVEELCKVPGISMALAQKVHDHFRRR